MEQTVSRQYAWQVRKVRSGACYVCGQEALTMKAGMCAYCWVEKSLVSRRIVPPLKSSKPKWASTRRSLSWRWRVREALRTAIVGRLLGVQNKRLDPWVYDLQVDDWLRKEWPWVFSLMSPRKRDQLRTLVFHWDQVAAGKKRSPGRKAKSTKKWGTVSPSSTRSRTGTSGGQKTLRGNA